MNIVLWVLQALVAAFAVRVERDRDERRILDRDPADVELIGVLEALQLATQ